MQYSLSRSSAPATQLHCNSVCLCLGRVRQNLHAEAPLIAVQSECTAIDGLQGDQFIIDAVAEECRLCLLAFSSSYFLASVPVMLDWRTSHQLRLNPSQEKDVSRAPVVSSTTRPSLSVDHTSVHQRLRRSGQELSASARRRSVQLQVAGRGGRRLRSEGDRSEGRHGRARHQGRTWSWGRQLRGGLDSGLC